MGTPAASSTNSETPQTNASRRAGRTPSRLPAIMLGVAGVLLTAAGVYDTVHGNDRAGDRIDPPTAAPRSTGGPAAHDGAPSTPEPDRTGPDTAAPGAVPRTTDPIAYATGVATVLFGWDTTTGPGRADRLRALMREAAPSTTDAEDLASDLANYLPSTQAWGHLSDYQTRQTLRIDHAVVPDSWYQAKAAAGDGLAAGTVAVTIDGIRRRAGLWNGETLTSEHQVAFTVFVACPPADGSCRLLRLSDPNTPLR